MFGLGNNDDDERFRNLIMFNFYGTDKELEEVSPILAIVIVLVIIGGIIWLSI